jgi:DNA-binding GntR family transcriptional regulator
MVAADLVESLGVTRSGVRLAIDGLAAEGLVAAKAAERATDDEIAALRAHGDRMGQAVDDAEHLRYSALIEELHALIRQIARQPAAAELIERLGAQVVRHQFQLSLRSGRPRVSLRELTAVIDAIAAHRPDEAEAAARAHLRSVITALSETTP